MCNYNFYYFPWMWDSSTIEEFYEIIPSGFVIFGSNRNKLWIIKVYNKISTNVDNERHLKRTWQPHASTTLQFLWKVNRKLDLDSFAIILRQILDDLLQTLLEMSASSLVAWDLPSINFKSKKWSKKCHYKNFIYNKAWEGLQKNSKYTNNIWSK